MKKIIKLTYATLEPALLHGTRDTIATHGKVHASATRFIRVEGQDYALGTESAQSDVLIAKPAIAQAAAALWDLIGQEIADQTGSTVEYTVNGEIRTFEPSK